MEEIPVANLRARLAALRAQFMADRSSNVAHIYWIAHAQRYLKVTRKGPIAKLSYHTTCPCSGG